MGESYQVTVLIPTFNRYDYLQRLLKYLSVVFDNNYVKFIVLDGSDKAAAANEALCARYNIEYRHYGPQVKIFERFLDGLNRAETDMVAFLADDDLVHPTGLFRCVEFLRDHPDYSAAHGEYATFLHDKSGYKLMEPYVISPLEQEHPLDRLNYMLSHYDSLTIFYAVYKTDVLRRAFAETVCTVSEEDMFFLEILPACIAAVKGKIQILDDFYYARQICEAVPRKSFDPARLVFEPDFSARYKKVKNGIIKCLDVKIDREKADNAIDLCFANYFAQCMTIRGIDSRYQGLILTPQRWRDQKFSHRWFQGWTAGLIRFLRRNVITLKKRLYWPCRDDARKALEIYYRDD